MKLRTKVIHHPAKSLCASIIRVVYFHTRCLFLFSSYATPMTSIPMKISVNRS